MKRLFLIGAGGHGKVVADAAEAAGYTDIRFVDRSWPERVTHGRWPIVASECPDTESEKFCAVGHNATRARLFADLALDGSPALIHPATVLSPSAEIAAGTLVVAGVIVNADTRIGRGVILNTGASVDHDCVIGDFVHISPGAHVAGGVTLGARSWIGIGAVVKEGITIGCDAVIAAGAAVVHDVEDGARVGGVPARKL